MHRRLRGRSPSACEPALRVLGLDTSNLCQELCDYLTTEVLRAGSPVREDDVLSELGVDSFSIMELVLFVERRFGVVLPMERLTPESIRTVRTLAACVARAAP